jgi:hypothetical protein
MLGMLYNTGRDSCATYLFDRVCFRAGGGSRKNEKSSCVGSTRISDDDDTDDDGVVTAQFPYGCGLPPQGTVVAIDVEFGSSGS